VVGNVGAGADEAAMAGVAAGEVRAALHRFPVVLRQVVVLAYSVGTPSVRSQF
jgi:hypothetical protein